MKRNNLSKTIYDFAKVAFAGLVITPITMHASLNEAIWGSGAVVAILVLAWLIDEQGGTEK